MSAPVTSGPAVRRSADALDRVIVGWLTVLTALSTLFAVFFLPQYVGVVPLPVSAFVGAAVVFGCTRLSYRLTGSMLAAAAPAVGWLVAAVYLSFSRTLGYALVIGDWRATLLLGVGALAAAMGVGLSWGTHQLALVDARRPGRAVPGAGPAATAVPGVTTDHTSVER